MAILATEKVLTLDYWKPARKIEVGDYVFDKDGKLVKVKLVFRLRHQNVESDSAPTSKNKSLGARYARKKSKNWLLPS